jgi:hypothetical protein
MNNKHHLTNLIDWLPQNWARTVLRAFIAAGLIFGFMQNSWSQGIFNVYGPQAGVQYNPGGTFQDTAATGAQVAATYTGLTNCTGTAALLFNATCSPFAPGVASLTATFVGYGSASNTLTGDAGFTYNTSLGILSLLTTNGQLVLPNNSATPNVAQIVPTYTTFSSQSGIAIGVGTVASTATGTSLCNAQGIAGTATTFYTGLLLVPNSGDFLYCSGAQNPDYVYTMMDNHGAGVGALEFVNSTADGPALSASTAAAIVCKGVSGNVIPTISAPCSVLSSDTSTGSASYPLCITDKLLVCEAFYSPNAVWGALGDTTPVKWYNVTSTGTSQVSVTMGDAADAASVTNIVGGSAANTQANGSPICTASGAGCPAIPTGANPSALVGLTTINGSATTFMRSDAAPSLSLGIVPTWINEHTFASGLEVSGGISLLTASTGSADFTANQMRMIAFGANSSTVAGFNLLTASSTASILRSAFNVTTSGGSQTAISLGNTADLPAITLDGPVTIPAPGSGNPLTVLGVVSTTVAQTGTLCWATGGAITYDPSLGCLTSSARFKDHVTNLDTGLTQIMALRPVHYQLRPEFNAAHLGEQVGLIAEEVQKVDPRLIGLDDKGQPLGVRYAQLTALLVKGEQDLERQVWQLRAVCALLALWCAGLTWSTRRGGK